MGDLPPPYPLPHHAHTTSAPTGAERLLVDLHRTADAHRVGHREEPDALGRLARRGQAPVRGAIRGARDITRGGAR
ncbi:hypothetical protein CD790_27735 [Streptomyces sp. SAJ15]|nr:hypothetical protein CD790_27735 [Streptomyces sp. SAJ15]